MQRFCSLVAYFELSLTSFSLVLIQSLAERSPRAFSSWPLSFQYPQICFSVLMYPAFSLPKFPKEIRNVHLQMRQKSDSMIKFVSLGFLPLFPVAFFGVSPLFRFATRTLTLNISKSPATTYQIRPMSLLARKIILMPLRCEGCVVLMSWRRIHL